MDVLTSARAASQAREHANHVASKAIAAATEALGKPLPAPVQRRIVKAIDTLIPDMEDVAAKRDELYRIQSVSMAQGS